MTPTRKHLSYFTLLSTIPMLMVTWVFVQDVFSVPNTVYTTVFNVLVWLSYSFFYVFLALLPLWLLSRWLAHYGKLTAISAVILSSIVILFIKSDAMIFDLYNFHFNAFIWNLMITPGGMSSLGSGSDTYTSAAISGLIVVVVQTLLWWLSGFLAKQTTYQIRWKYLIILLVSMTLTERITYGVSDIKNIGSILTAVKMYPFYQKTRFRDLASLFGVSKIKQDANQLSIHTENIHYPLASVVFSPVKTPPNIVILAVESLRWDRLSPEIMPNTWQFSEAAQRYTQHYSSGNGTREGLFGLFYGLYGSYWDSFLHAQQSPLLMDRLQALGYQLDIRTSARFTYPEFNQTLFSKLDPKQLHEMPESSPPWQRDQDNTSALIAFLKQQKSGQPFMSFFFFESTHARYDFPESAVIASPYLKDVNYYGMSRASLAPQIGALKNRYTNAAHWVDVQLGRIIDQLQSQGLLENTIVIITGDHGEEFLEKGFWGHNSSFVEEQTHTPMVIAIPHTPHQVITRITSHLDISPTLLQLLGAPADSKNYSLGTSMINPAARDFIVVSDWHSINVTTANMKYRIPYVSKGFESWQPTDLKDQALTSEQANLALKDNQLAILTAMRNASKFLEIKHKKP